MWEHYKVKEFSIREEDDKDYMNIGMDKIREFFNDDIIIELNWLFLGTSGIHSWYGTLDEAEEEIKHIGEIDDDGETLTAPKITLLIVHSRVCCIQYGEVVIETQEDIDFLRKWVTKTIDCIGSMSQYGNLDKTYRTTRFEEKAPERHWI